MEWDSELTENKNESKDGGDLALVSERDLGCAVTQIRLGRTTGRVSVPYYPLQSRWVLVLKRFQLFSFFWGQGRKLVEILWVDGGIRPIRLMSRQKLPKHFTDRVVYARRI